MPVAIQHAITAETSYCAVYGHPIKHSASPPMQNAGITALGLDWRYLAFDVHPDQLKEAITGARAMKFIGLNLTVPHKILALKIVDVLDESARTWGAVNTIRFEARSRRHSKWRTISDIAPDEISDIRSRGFNTDADAIARSVEEDLGFKLRASSVLVLGAGGAGRVAALKMAERHVKELFLVNRTQSKAEDVAGEIQRRFPKVQVRLEYPRKEIDLVLNATSLGLKASDPLPLESKTFKLNQSRHVYDMIYRPAETPLLKAARAAGCRTANGTGMLLYQGAAALEIWSGKRPPVAVMRQALLESLSRY